MAPTSKTSVLRTLSHQHSVCVCVHVHVCSCVCGSECLCERMSVAQVNFCLCFCASVLVCLCACVLVCLCVCVFVCVCVGVFVCLMFCGVWGLSVIHIGSLRRLVSVVCGLWLLYTSDAADK